MKQRLTLAAVLILFSAFSIVNAQDLLNELDSITTDKKKKEFVTATFKGTRIINGQSVENPAKGVLQFMISHRFGQINDGIYQLFGLDQSTIRLGFDYGITDGITVAVGRSSLEKTYDGYLKVKLLRQSKGYRSFPFSVTGMAGFATSTIKFSDKKLNAGQRTTYTYQAVIARKFGERLSLQISPTLLHRNLVATKEDKNDVFSIGFAGRMKLTKRLSFNAEYFYLLPDQVTQNVYNSMSFGFDIETGGHVFQLHFTNSKGMIEKFFIPQTTGDWGNGDIYFGFNISRVFTVGKRKKA